jgi:hypothetical protein
MLYLVFGYLVVMALFASSHLEQLAAFLCR